MERIFEVGDKINNFEVISVGEATEIGGVLYELKSPKCDSRIMFMSTEDSNKLFSVSFKTIPTDDTGVFHILEHSVLGGSSKFPVREPFVEMLKSSMNTFLNAMTFPDKTMYPVSSCNSKDFLNLTSVYLDAVFKPAIYTNPNIFYQEGWHYEVDENKNVTINGVVYNEMKGAESSYDERIECEINKLLYPDNCYKYVSGGATRSIPELTYEKFIETHKKFYSPDNACFYIEGDISKDLFTEVLGMIDEYLYKEESFDESVVEIKPQSKVDAKRSVVYYPIGEDEDKENKTHFSFAKKWTDGIDFVRMLGAQLINGYLNSSNSSPLAKRVVEAGLATDVYIDISIFKKYGTLSVNFLNSSEENEEKIREVMREVRDEIRANGFDKEELEAHVSRLEFNNRETREPRAVEHAIGCVTSLFCGDDPIDGVTANPVIKVLREGIDNGLFERLFEEIFDESDMCLVVAKPSKTLAAEEAAQEKEYIRNKISNWSDEDFERAIQIEKNLKAWQATPETEEQLATIPKLTLEDITDKPREYISNETIIDGVKVVSHPVSIDEITYLKFAFPIPKKYQERMSEVNFLGTLFTELPTENFEVNELNRFFKKHFGSFSTGISINFAGEDANDTSVYLAMSISVLKKNFGEVKNIVEEVLLKTNFDNKDKIYNYLKQVVEAEREDVISEGHLIARTRARSSSSVFSSVQEQISGYESYRRLKSFRDDFDNRIDDFIKFAKEFVNDVVIKNSLIISIANNMTNNLEQFDIKGIIDVFPEGKSDDYKFDFVFPYVGKTFIKIPGKVGHVASSFDFNKIGMNLGGNHSVITNAVKLEYLWNRVRVQGGAYGVSADPSRDNVFSLISYRDPSPAKTIEVYRNVPEALRLFFENDINLEKFIISSVNDTEPIVSPRSYANSSFRRYLSKLTYEDRLRERKQMLETSKQDLLEFAKKFDEINANDDFVCTCIVGSDIGEFDADVVFEI